MWRTLRGGGDQSAIEHPAREPAGVVGPGADRERDPVDERQ
jgi:hypothetical protein